MEKENEEDTKKDIDIISIKETKRDGGGLNRAQIHFFIKELITDRRNQFQIGALLMIFTILGMNSKETAILTEEIAEKWKSMGPKRDTRIKS